MPEIVNCFPLSVFKDRLGLDEAERHAIGRHVLDSFARMKEAGWSKRYSWTGDRHGHDRLQHQDICAPLFRALHPRLRRYVSMLGLDADRFRFNIIRSWGTVSEKGHMIQRHKHVQSHISIAYYPLMAAGTGMLRFHTEESPNAFMPSLFHSQSMEHGLMKEENQFNCETVNMAVAEDDIVLFPSKALHSTEPNQTDEDRVSISADIVVTLADAANLELMMPDIDQWRPSDSFS